MWRSGGAIPLVRRSLSPPDRGHCPRRVQDPCGFPSGRRTVLSLESGCLRVQPEAGGKLHLRLNTTTRPIANKYREGKLQRTLKREFKST